MIQKNKIANRSCSQPVDHNILYISFTADAMHVRTDVNTQTQQGGGCDEIYHGAFRNIQYFWNCAAASWMGVWGRSKRSILRQWRTEYFWVSVSTFG
jgi:hypothetical protein